MVRGVAPLGPAPGDRLGLQLVSVPLVFKSAAASCTGTRRRIARNPATDLRDMKREIDTLLTDRDMALARRVSHTDFRGTVHPTLSLGNLRQPVVWGGAWCPLSRSEN